MTKPYPPSEGFYSSSTAQTSLVDVWATPRDRWYVWNREFNFTLDAAALKSSALCDLWFGPDHDDVSRRDAFAHSWVDEAPNKVVWLNPPYSREIGRWLAKANSECQKGATVVCLIPARTDTSWWHDWCAHHEVRFIRGRLKFGQSINNAPFPSALVVMRP